MIESYYLESSDGLLCAVKGLIHPAHAVVAYLRYIPDPNGDREKKGVRYRRLYHFEKQEELLRARYPAYLFFDPVFGGQLQGVPRERIERVYDPCRKLADLRCREGLDDLEERAVEFTELLAGSAKVPEMSLGVSGSILVGLHTPRSDLDLVVYGSEHCRAVHRALKELLDEAGNEVRRMNESETRELYAARSQDTPIPFESFSRLEGRKVIQGRFRGGEYFIRFVKAAAEIRESYGEETYTPLGQAEIEATVTDASEAIFTPCVYRVELVRFKGVHTVDKQPVLPAPEEIVSYRGRFCEQAREGDRVYARGKLERVVSTGGKVSHRLLLGGRGDSMTARVS